MNSAKTTRCKPAPPRRARLGVLQALRARVYFRRLTAAAASTISANSSPAGSRGPSRARFRGRTAAAARHLARMCRGRIREEPHLEAAASESHAGRRRTAVTVVRPATMTVRVGGPQSSLEIGADEAAADGLPEHRLTGGIASGLNSKPIAGRGRRPRRFDAERDHRSSGFAPVRATLGHAGSRRRCCFGPSRDRRERPLHRVDQQQRRLSGHVPTLSAATPILSARRSARHELPA